MKQKFRQYGWAKLFALLSIALVITGVTIGCTAPLQTTAPQAPEQNSEVEQNAEAETAVTEAEAAQSSDQAVEAPAADNQTVAEAEPEVSEASVAAAEVPPLTGVSQDYTLVGTTGRPQLVYTFADW